MSWLRWKTFGWMSGFDLCDFMSGSFDFMLCNSRLSTTATTSMVASVLRCGILRGCQCCRHGLGWSCLGEASVSSQVTKIKSRRIKNTILTKTDLHVLACVSLIKVC